MGRGRADGWQSSNRVRPCGCCTAQRDVLVASGGIEVHAAIIEHSPREAAAKASNFGAYPVPWPHPAPSGLHLSMLVLYAASHLLGSKLSPRLLGSIHSRIHGSALRSGAIPSAHLNLLNMMKAMMRASLFTNTGGCTPVGEHIASPSMLRGLKCIVVRHRKTRTMPSRWKY